MKKLFILLFAISTLVSLTACDGLITKAVTSILNIAGSDGKNPNDENDKDVKMRFSACERQDDGQTSNGAYSALDVSLAVPEGEGEAQHNVARGIRAICDRSPVAEELGKASADASIEGVADYYASAFKKGLKTGKVYPLCTYSLRISEKFQNKVGVVFSVTTGVWGNGGPWEYDTFVRFSDGNVLDSKNMINISKTQLRALVKKYGAEELSTMMSVEEGDYQVMPTADGKANLHISMGSHFFEDVEVPEEEITSYLTAEGKAVFEADGSTPAQQSQTQQSTTTNAAAEAFTLTNGKLGPIQTGQRFANIPAAYKGLYDKYAYKKETMWGEGGDEWEEEYYQFTKAGKKIFRVLIYDGKIGSIELQAGSASIIKTQEGFYVGYPARTLFTKKRMEWTTYYEGTAFATSGHYTYYVNDSDINTDSPDKVSDFKPNAKISMIVYSHNVESY